MNGGLSESWEEVYYWSGNSALVKALKHKPMFSFSLLFLGVLCPTCSVLSPEYGSYSRKAFNKKMGNYYYYYGSLPVFKKYP